MDEAPVPGLIDPIAHRHQATPEPPTSIYFKVGLVQQFDSATRRAWPLAADFEQYGPGALYDRLNDDELLRFADLLV